MLMYGDFERELWGKELYLPDEFQQLAEIEPALYLLEAAILKYAKENMDRDGFCAKAIWYGYGNGPGINFSKAIDKFVGPEASSRNPIVKLPEAHSLVKSHLYHLLPNCGYGCCGYDCSV